MQLDGEPVADPGNPSSLASGGEPSSGRAWKPNLGLTEHDLERWERKGEIAFLWTIPMLNSKPEDQVQWHRAWAEMMRWLEEFELKHVEFVRCITGFDAMMSAWSAVATKETREGYAAFARSRSDIYRRLRDQAEDLFQKNAEPHLLEFRENLIKGIQTLRERELGWLWKMAGTQKEIPSDDDPGMQGIDGDSGEVEE
jgi:hypothetical protein